MVPMRVPLIIVTIITVLAFPTRLVVTGAVFVLS